MAEPTSPLERLIELLVFAPVGLVLTAKEDLGALVDRGRHSVESQVLVAKFVGRLAVAQASRGASDLLEQAMGRVADRQPAAGSSSATADAGVEGAPRVTPDARHDGVRARSPEGNGHAGAETGRAAGPDELQLAIPGYDSLSAAHVVQRLGGLTDAELDAVRRYEQAHRGRRTILSKIEQLRAGRT